jgi:hypothetical protein
MSGVINLRNIDNAEQPKELDRLLIPNEIYDITIQKDTDAIEKYFLKNIRFMSQFVGFNSYLKKANYLASDRKCGCFYKVPWITKWASENNETKTILLFNQQVKEYRYMIRYWYPSPEISYMRYLSSIALNLILIIKRYIYNKSNNLVCSELQCNKNIIKIFGNSYIQFINNFYNIFYLKK